MEVQSLSIDVPVNSCINNCKFCCVKLHKNPYMDNIQFNEIKKRLQFAVNNGCNTVILTGRGEPLQNPEFLKMFHLINQSLTVPFVWIELQTSGIYLNNPESIELLKMIGVTTISLSISDLFNDVNNMDLIGVPTNNKFSLVELCNTWIKPNGFNLRLSLNLTSAFNGHELARIYEHAKKLNADQITFRKLYVPDNADNKIASWIKENKIDNDTYSLLKSNLKTSSKEIDILPYGAIVYDYKGISMVMDDDCMNEELSSIKKYFILRPNSKLYSKWDTPASLIF